MVQRSAIYQNGSTGLGDYGLNFSITGSSTFREVVVDQNGVGVGTVTGGVDMGDNVCNGGGTSCP